MLERLSEPTVIPLISSIFLVVEGLVILLIVRCGVVSDKCQQIVDEDIIFEVSLFYKFLVDTVDLF